MTLRQAAEYYAAKGGFTFKQLMAPGITREMWDTELSGSYGSGNFDGMEVVIWSPTHVMFVSEYDGMETLTQIPRNPPRGKV